MCENRGVLCMYVFVAYNKRGWQINEGDSGNDSKLNGANYRL